MIELLNPLQKYSKKCKLFLDEDRSGEGDAEIDRANFEISMRASTRYVFSSLIIGLCINLLALATPITIYSFFVLIYRGEYENRHSDWSRSLFHVMMTLYSPR